LAVFIALFGSGCDRVLGIENPEAARVDAGVDSPPGVHLISVELSPDPLNLPVGEMKQLKAIATFSDNTKKDVTSQSTFQLDSGSSATITPGGLVKGLAQGASRVSANFQMMSGHIDVVIGPIVPDHIVISTGDYTTAQNQVALLSAKLFFSDNSSNDVTFDATWSSDNPAVATADGFNGITSIGPGSATITVIDQGVSSSFVITVTAAQCHPVINEVQSGSAAGDSDEWVEVYNPCTSAIDVTNWTLDYRSANATGATDTNLLVTLPSGTMSTQSMFLFCSNTATELGFCDAMWTGGVMATQNGAVGLRSGAKDTGALVDSMAYGTVMPGHPFVEGTSALPLVNGKVLARLPFDGIDQNNNVGDFVLTDMATPGGFNATD
jgi:hypothetical protein